MHNELEQEQESQVNRMLQLIREQQQQLDALRAQQGHRSRSSSQATPHRPLATPAMSRDNTAVVDDLTPSSERSLAFPSVHPAVSPLPQPIRRSSRRAPSASRSPALRPMPARETSSSGEWPPSPTEGARRNSIRDEGAYFQAETSTLTRENQMLRQRVRELERQLVDGNVPANTPHHPSNLMTSPPVEALEEASQAAAVESRKT